MNNISLIHRMRNKIKVQKNNHIHIGSHVGLSNCKIIIKGQNNTLLIADHSRLRKMTIEIIGDGCIIEIGKQCVIGQGCYLSAKENVRLQIGDGCMFSRNVNILTSDGHFIFQYGKKLNPPCNITIGDHVWLADGATILKGVTIGSGSAVGIHSLVTKSVPNNSLAVGIPAKVIKSHIEWES